MIIEASETETLIKETAKKVFFAKGHINASTKEIAKEAGVNRALIHYYFRSRDFLFNSVLEEAMLHLNAKIGAILGSDLSLKDKIIRFLDTFIHESAEYPYLETFVVAEIAKNPEKMKNLGPKDASRVTAALQRQLQQEIAAGRMRPVKVEHFMLNLMSMCSYPLIAKPLIQTILGYDEKAYRSFLKERKKAVFEAIFQEDYSEG